MRTGRTSASGARLRQSTHPGPYQRVELLFNLPPYLEHNNPKIHAGVFTIRFPF